MKNSQILFALLLLFCLPHSALALERVECWNLDCLVHGWTLTGIDSEGFTDYQCLGGDCQRQGWIIGGTRGIENYVSCKPQGCFVEGYYEIHRPSQRLLRQVICNKSDCLRQGWTGIEPDGQSITECIAKDCRHQGWRTIWPGYRVKTSRCAKQNCFRFGWTVE